jgi:hypothetical protein
MTRSPAAVAVAIAVLVTASCSGTSATKSAPSSTTVAATTIAPPPPTTATLSPTELAEAEVRAAWADIARQSEACYRQPAECRPEEFDVEPELSAYASKVEREFTALGRHAEPNPTETAYSVVSGPILFSDDGATAAFTVCTWDTDILVQDEPRVVINDLNQTIFENVVLRKERGRWFFAGDGSAGPHIIGRNDCGPRP